MTTTRQKKATATGLTLQNTLAAAGLLLGLATASPAAAVQCGDTIGPNVTVTLSGTIVCDNTTGGLTIVGPAEVDLTQFTILCDDTNQDGTVPTGLVLSGKKVQVYGGAVAFCDTGVEVTGEGRHTVERMDVQASLGTSFLIRSDKNTLQRNRAAIDNVGFAVEGKGNILLDNTADGYHDRGFSVESNKNQLDRNVASHSNLGFLLSGKSNKLTENEAADNMGVGFYVQYAEKITLRKNRVLRNGGSGFVIFFGEKNKLTENEARLNGQNGIILLNTIKNKLTHNVAFDNNQSNFPGRFDLTDQTANCGTNTWEKNTFGTASQPCIQ